MSLSSDRVKTEHELEMVMAEKNLRDLWDGTERNDKRRNGNAGERRLRNFVCVCAGGS